MPARRRPSSPCSWGGIGAFDCRINELPNAELVVDYFRWRHEDASRNALNVHCHWALRREGVRASEATRNLAGMSVARKDELLFTTQSLNFDDLPSWQKCGTGLYWETHTKKVTHPSTGEPLEARRRRIKRDYALPAGEQYGEFIRRLVEESTAYG